MAHLKLVRVRVASNALDLKEFTLEHLRRATGFYPEELQPEVDALIEEGYLERRGSGFVLSSDPAKRMELCNVVEAYYRGATSEKEERLLRDETREEGLANVVRMIIVCIFTACAGACFTFALVPNIGASAPQFVERLAAGAVGGLLVGLAMWCYAIVQAT